MTSYNFSQPWLSKLNGDKQDTALEFNHLRSYIRSLNDGLLGFDFLNVGTLAATTVNATSALQFKGFASIPILQIQTGTSATASTTTSVTFVATNLTKAITPNSALSKILIIAEGDFASNGNAGARAAATLARGGTDLSPGGNGFTQVDSDGITVLERHTTLVYIDSPATTSSTTYDVRIRKSSGTTTAQWGDNSTDQIIYLIEIGF